MRILSIVLIILQSYTLSAQCGNRYSTAIFPNISTTSYEFGQNTTYTGANQKLNLDLYTPNGDTFKNRPCVVFCFGGAFVQGTRTSPELVFFARTLAQRGFVCASIDYRLDDTANMRIKGENGAVIRAVQDAKAAIRYLKSKSSEFGIDSNMIFIGGTSAGGVTALTLGYSQFDELKDSVKTAINSLGGWEGTTNALSQSSNVKGLFNFSGAVLDTVHISSNDLPVYLNHANKDAVVPFRSGYPLNGQSSTFMHGSFNIAQRMKSKGNFYVMDSFNSADHPAFSSTDFLLALTNLNLTSENLRKFLYKVMKCDQGSSSILSSNSQKWTFENPVTNYIKLTDGMDPKELNLYNIMGQRMELKEISSNGFNVSHLPRGIYILNFQTTSQKIVLE
jgi:acetyl esterase/lipase